jgi:beta-carotene 3-hydroxylase
MSPWTIIGIIALTFVAMEAVAWATHKFVMHGFLWHLHSDHHRKDHYGFLERNDTFFLIFAVPSMVLFIVGSVQGLHTPWLWIGLGILLYGIAYFLVHEVFIHQRIKWLRNTRNVYFLALRKAHKIHHKRLGKEDGECFGMLVVPWKYVREARRTLALQRSGSGRTT